MFIYIRPAKVWVHCETDINVPVAFWAILAHMPPKQSHPGALELAVTIYSFLLSFNHHLREVRHRLKTPSSRYRCSMEKWDEVMNQTESTHVWKRPENIPKGRREKFSPSVK